MQLAHILCIAASPANKCVCLGATLRRRLLDYEIVNIVYVKSCNGVSDITLLMLFRSTQSLHVAE